MTRKESLEAMSLEIKEIEKKNQENEIEIGIRKSRREEIKKKIIDLSLRYPELSENIDMELLSDLSYVREFQASLVRLYNTKKQECEATIKRLEIELNG